MSSRLPFFAFRGKHRPTSTSAGATSATLPPPATATGNNAAPSGHAVAGKRATFEEPPTQTGLKVHWSRFKKRLGNGSNPSESVLEITDGGSESQLRRGPGTLSDGQGQADDEKEEGEGVDDEEVDEVVVHNSFAMLGASKSAISAPSEVGVSPERMGGSQSGAGTHAPPMTDLDSSHDHDRTTNCLVTAFNIVRYRIWSGLRAFYLTSFHDPGPEAQYKKETYFQMKGLALSGSLFLLTNWILILIVIQNTHSIILPDKIFYYGVSPLLLVPMPVMIMFDWPKFYPLFYQAWMGTALFAFSAYSLILIQICGYYDPSKRVVNCGNKEFTSIFYYLAAFPVIGLFALGQKRLTATFFGILNFVGVAAVIPEKQTWIRNMLNYGIFIVFLLWVHYQRELAERRLYTMRDRLKVQYRETQKAQVRESRAADSKKRFSSYIFHEVRVPLNTALLAVQNMGATGVFDKDNIEYMALEGSLNMMSKVLNDVLDFNRMDSGRFESVSKPYAFHKVIKSMLVPLSLAADARGLGLEVDLDPAIDVVSRRALYTARGFGHELIEKLMQEEEEDEESGLVVGDEHRLRQIVTNLTSNACKFTPTGGKICVRTRLIIVGRKPVECDAAAVPLPATPPLRRSSVDSQISPISAPAAARESSEGTAVAQACDLEKGDVSNPSTYPVLTANRLEEMLNSLPSAKLPKSSTQEKIVIRIEVEDTGVGIKKKDMADSRLFSPYVQTDIGRYQGGKGTGLGLALSKHIVRLSGGRLGVKSKRNRGSTFWVELAMGIGQEVLRRSDGDLKTRLVQQSFPLQRPTSTESATAVAEAFKLPVEEGATPSSCNTGRQSILDSNEGPPPTRTDASFLPSKETTQAMRQLMEHSGQIDIRMDHRGLGSAGPHQSMEALAAQAISGEGGVTTIGIPLKTSSRQLSMKEGRIGSNLRPKRVSMPPPQFSFGTTLDSNKGTNTASTGTASGTGGGTPFEALAVPTLAARPVTPPVTATATTNESTSITNTSGTPPRPGASLVPPPTTAPPDGPFQPPLNVLVVDDDPLTRKLMSRMLTRNGCNVETAENGQAALTLATSVKNPFTFKPPPVPADGERPKRVQTPYAQEDGTRYDVVFLDNQMPVMSGVDMVRKLRALGRYDYVVGVTGNALKEDQEEYISAGVDAVLTKPVKEEFLKNCLVAADERRRELAAASTRGGAKPPLTQPP